MPRQRRTGTSLPAPLSSEASTHQTNIKSHSHERGVPWASFCIPFQNRLFRPRIEFAHLMSSGACGAGNKWQQTPLSAAIDLGPEVMLAYNFSPIVFASGVDICASGGEEGCQQPRWSCVKRQTRVGCTGGLSCRKYGREWNVVFGVVWRGCGFCLHGFRFCLAWKQVTPVMDNIVWSFLFCGYQMPAFSSFWGVCGVGTSSCLW